MSIDAFLYECNNFLIEVLKLIKTICQNKHETIASTLLTPFQMTDLAKNLKNGFRKNEDHWLVARQMMSDLKA